MFYHWSSTEVYSVAFQWIWSVTGAALMGHEELTCKCGIIVVDVREVAYLAM